MPRIRQTGARPEADEHLRLFRQRFPICIDKNLAHFKELQVADLLGVVSMHHLQKPWDNGSPHHRLVFGKRVQYLDEASSGIIRRQSKLVTGNPVHKAVRDNLGETEA